MTPSEPGDVELLDRLRAGDNDAYTLLWQRHIGVALRLGRRLDVVQAEDLASEAFLAVYRQVTSGGGPETHFRAYLFTTMRNLAAVTRRERERIDDTSTAEEYDLRDGLRFVEQRSTAEGLLRAFESLPPRWQRVLWLSEIEGVKRPRLAAELGIRPNAVSALLGRAKARLREQWLAQLIPPARLREPGHVADLLPAYLADRHSPHRAVIAEHLRHCALCSDLVVDLRAASSQVKGVTLAFAGFAALGTILPAASSTAPATAAGVLGGLGTGIVAGVSVLAAGAAITTAMLLAPTVIPPLPQEEAAAPVEAAETSPRGEASGPVTVVPPEEDRVDEEPTLGRGNTDDDAPEIEFDSGAPVGDFYVPPPAPVQAPPGLFSAPVETGAALGPGLDPGSAADGYLAPVLTGRTTPGASVAVVLDRRPDAHPTDAEELVYVLEADGFGEWSLDLRPVLSDLWGTYDYQVWAFTGLEVSPPEQGSFVLAPPELLGFEWAWTDPAIPLVEASTTGVLFRVQGPPGGTACLVSVYSGQAVEIPLDDTGTAIRRIRLLSAGTYYLTVRACAEGYRGPAAETIFDVVDPEAPIFGPWGPDPADTVFELSEP